MHSLRRLCLTTCALSLGIAGGVRADAAALQAFADHCFSPYLTAETAQDALSSEGVRIDFYDTRPFSSAEPSPPAGRPATPGTDRRCEVAFDGTATDAGIAAVASGLSREGITAETDVPAGFPALDTSAFVAARLLNPRRIAVVQVGTRPGPHGTETYLNVERLDPLPNGVRP
ncbi:succinyl-CoA synthetase subunit beta [Sulfitobacter sp. HNIBRBA3233]|uniref:succinyl-CoA synthetase subunit beta n=1 Tax=Sulfitobacter marinivivus TaxID=3158558 RepID=UPI0032DEEBEA